MNQTELPLPMRSDAVHIWFTLVDEIRDEQLLAAYRSLLSIDERRRLHSFRFPADRHRFLVGRALNRTVLGTCTGIAPEQLIFAGHRSGRPYLGQGAGSTPVQFSSSSTSGMVAIAVGLGRDIGLDVEHSGKPVDCADIAARYFSRRECQDLGRLEKAPAAKRFFQYWTLKEAYLKAIGLGLPGGLDRAGFLIDDAGPDQQAEYLAGPEKPEDWSFRLFSPGPDHIAACAVRKPAGRPVETVCYQSIPLRHTRALAAPRSVDPPG